MNFDMDKFLKDRNENREMNIFISTHLFNKPLAFWWSVSNDDGVEMINYFTDVGDERYYEPLYEVTPNDPNYYDIGNQITLCPEHWKNGIHRWNLRTIPEYHKDLNLIRLCELELKEKNLHCLYIERMEYLLKTPYYEPTYIDIFNLLNMSSEDKAHCIVETLKEHLKNVSK